METLEIGCTPADEPCAQVGSDDYYPRARKECRVFKGQLYRMLEEKYGLNIPNIRLIIKSNPHDFGDYFECAVRFDENDAAAIEAAYWLESNLPSNWDAKALEELNAST